MWGSRGRPSCPRRGSGRGRRPPRRWPSARTPTTSSSAAGRRWPSGRAAVASSTTSCAPTDRRARGTSTPTPSRWSRRRQDEQREAARRRRRRQRGRGRVPRPRRRRARQRLAVRSEVARVIRELRPEVVLGHDPWKRYRTPSRPSPCRAAGLRGDRRCPRSALLPRARTPPSPARRRCCCSRPNAANHVEDVTGFVDRKLRALEAHVSQFESTMKATDEAQLEAFRSADPRPAWPSSGRPTASTAAEVFAVDHRSVTNWPGWRPAPGGPANAWAIEIHSVAASPSISSAVSAT